MMFATMEAALSVLVMSYIADLLSPALMLLAACITFYGASQFSPKARLIHRTCGAPPPPPPLTAYTSPPQAVAICRPILGLNVVYHLYLVARLVHQHEGTPFFSEEYTGPRAILISLGCVVMMELIALKKASSGRPTAVPPRHMPPCLPRPATPSALTASLPAQTLVQAGFFYAKLRIRPTAELDRMRMLRRAQVTRCLRRHHHDHHIHRLQLSPDAPPRAGRLGPALRHRRDVPADLRAGGGQVPLPRRPLPPLRDLQLRSRDLRSRDPLDARSPFPSWFLFFDVPQRASGDLRPRIAASLYPRPLAPP